MSIFPATKVQPQTALPEPSGPVPYGRLGVSVAYGAFTGKAAAIMRAKGCAGASTIDSLVYHPKIEYSCRAEPPCPTPPCGKTRCQHLRPEFIGRELNPDSAIVHADLIAIDEVSMVNAEMGRHLLSFGKKVLVLGDLAQLPPPDGVGYFTNRTPDFELTEIHRQALGSPVIKLATAVRNREQLQPGRHGSSFVIGDINRLTVADLLAHEQIIVGRHKTRAWANRRVRMALGFGGDIPQPGERVLCEKNDHRLRNSE
jgi:exodeoxyribonuclease-5